MAEGQHPLPHPRRLLEDRRSTASLLMENIQEELVYAIANCPAGPLAHLLQRALLLKGHKSVRAIVQFLHFVKKIVERQVFSGKRSQSAGQALLADAGDDAILR
ncbi:hypothetical protein [Rhizobium sp. FY34]|uniref:hypothetical protein n=1 Tax=Rhizobium sp. FY34 TaxID=2562309 RepID=UPI0010BFD20E|nr:hypothetical protein [Rhizobium sp. FY34]